MITDRRLNSVICWHHSNQLLSWYFSKINTRKSFLYTLHQDAIHPIQLHPSSLSGMGSLHKNMWSGILILFPNILMSFGWQFMGDFLHKKDYFRRYPSWQMVCHLILYLTLISTPILFGCPTMIQTDALKYLKRIY